VFTKPTRNLDGAIHMGPIYHAPETTKAKISALPLGLPGSLSSAPSLIHSPSKANKAYGIKMLSGSFPDPDNLKTNNEVTKTQLKKRLGGVSPGPGDYHPKGTARANNTLENIADKWKTPIAQGTRNSRNKSQLDQESLDLNKAAAFNSSTPRFRTSDAGVKGV